MKDPLVHDLDSTDCLPPVSQDDHSSWLFAVCGLVGLLIGLVGGELLPF